MTSVEICALLNTQTTAEILVYRWTIIPSFFKKGRVAQETELVVIISTGSSEHMVVV